MTKEDALNIAVADYLRVQYPNVFWCHIPNGGSRNAIEGAKLKRMGVRPGMPDIMIYEAKGEAVNLLYTSGLFIELKIKPNKPSETQNVAMNELKRHGWAGGVCYSFEEAKRLIDNYLK